MIDTKEIEFPFTNDINEIESNLKKIGIDPLRWAIIYSDEVKIRLSISYESKSS